MKLKKVEAVPELRKQRRSKYRDLLRQFVESGDVASEVVTGKTKTNTAYQRLRRFAAEEGVKVTMRAGSIYLERV